MNHLATKDASPVEILENTPELFKRVSQNAVNQA